MENLIAVYASREAAHRVREKLMQSGIAPSDIALSPDVQAAVPSAEREHDHSWWDWLFGSDVSDSDRSLYRGTLGSERTAVSVRLRDAGARTSVENLMHDEGAVDLSGLRQPSSSVASPAEVSSRARSAAAGASTAMPATATASEEGETHIQLAKEELVVGKQQTERRIHVRVYPVTRPVEESVRLRDERVVIERRPVTGDTTSEPGLAPRDLEIIERHEEPVAAKRKTATEEVIVRKDVNERTETVRDTVTETKVDVDRPEAARHRK